MSNYSNSRSYLAALAAAIFVVPLLATCGVITEKSRIRVAKVGGEYFTRGDLEEAIRDFPAEEKPQIRTKGDLRVVLSEIIDESIKRGQATALIEQGKINVARQEAEVQYIMRYPEKSMQFLQLRDVLPESDLKPYEEDRELAIDREEERMYADRALIHLINEAVQNGSLKVSEEQYVEQYELRKGQMYTFEQIAIHGVYLPLDAHEDWSAEVTKVLERMNNGGDPRKIAETYGEDKAGYLEVGLTNQGANPKFTMFWQQASESEVGDVLAAFIPDWQRTATVAGQTETIPIPDSQLVFRVTQYVPARQKTLEEAKPALRSSVLFAQMMDRLREQSGVEIYDENLPDPGLYDIAMPSPSFDK